MYNTLLLKKIPFEVFGVPWYLTMFSYDFGFEAIPKIWDIFLIEGIKFLFQLSIAILKCMAENIEMLKYEKLLVYIKAAIKKQLISDVVNLISIG